MLIKDIIAREVLDSRGNPTVEVDVILENGILGRSIVPSGASTGLKEAIELRDRESRYMGMGVKKAVYNVNNIIKPIIVGMEVTNQRKIDDLMIKLDGTYNKSKLGANAILGVSMSVLKAAAYSKGKKLYQYLGGNKMPVPLMNILNGGMHSNNNLDFQEFMIVPKHQKFKEALRMASEVFHKLKEILNKRGYSTSLGDEGGFTPNLSNNLEALDLIMEAIKKSGYVAGKDIFIALDIAANNLYKDGKYYLKSENKVMTTSELLKYYQILIFRYPIISLEDPFYEEDYNGFRRFTDMFKDRIQIVGDDIFVTNTKYLQKGINNKLCNAILIKPNQIGTMSEVFITVEMAKKNKYRTIISHRSGDSEDTFIADLSVGLNIGQIKCGSLSRSERICKYNQLLRIEEMLNK